MHLAEIEARATALSRRKKVVEEGVDRLMEIIGVAIADRLMMLHREFNQSREKDMSFDNWLSGQFDYDHYTVYNVFDRDDELKGLLSQVSRFGFDYRRQASVAANRKLKQAGCAWGVNDVLADIARL